MIAIAVAKISGVTKSDTQKGMDKWWSQPTIPICTHLYRKPITDHVSKQTSSKSANQVV
jgi:hypothetical protein